MYASIVLAILLTVTLPFAQMVPAARNAKSTAPAPHVTLRPQVVENGTDLVLYHFMGNVPRPIAFTPDGSSWSVMPHGVLKIAPDGTNTLFGGFSTYLSYQNIAYSNGFLWFSVYHGIERMKPDGSDQRLFQFSLVRDGFHYPGNLAAGSDGLYFTTQSYSRTHPSVIGRIDTHFALTLYSAPNVPGVDSSSPLITGPDGRLYFIGSQRVYNDKTSNYVTVTSLGRLEMDGSSTLLGSSNVCASPLKIVVALGAFYFIGTQFDAMNNALGNTLCRATPSGKIAQLTAAQLGNFGQGITSDSSGNLWISGLFGRGLYSYAIATKHVAGPYEPSFLGSLYTFLYTGPDQNIWLFGSYATNQVFYGAYVRHMQTIIPTSITLSAGDASMNFYVSEKVRGGPWTAASLDPAVATVSPASSLVGRFNVRQVGPGTTSIVVTDAYGNVSYEPVTSS